MNINNLIYTFIQKPIVFFGLFFAKHPFLTIGFVIVMFLVVYVIKNYSELKKQFGGEEKLKCPTK